MYINQDGSGGQFQQKIYKNKNLPFETFEWELLLYFYFQTALYIHRSINNFP